MNTPYNTGRAVARIARAITISIRVNPRCTRRVMVLPRVVRSSVALRSRILARGASNPGWPLSKSHQEILQAPSALVRPARLAIATAYPMATHALAHRYDRHRLQVKSAEFLAFRSLELAFLPRAARRPVVEFRCAGVALQRHGRMLGATSSPSRP